VPFWQKVKSAWNVLSLDCAGASRAQSESVDHALPPSRRTGLWLHLLICKLCRRYRRQIHFLHDCARAHPDKMNEASNGSLPPEARERIKRRLAEEKIRPG
jgi:hypothetical protein